MLPKIGKILALDVGTRCTGVAISDPAQKVAFARPEILHSNNKELQEAIGALVQEEKCIGLLIGRPLKLSGESTKQTDLVEETAALLSALQLPIKFIDERLSTEFAENLHGFQTKEKLHDSRAAQILLETHLK